MTKQQAEIKRLLAQAEAVYNDFHKKMAELRVKQQTIMNELSKRKGDAEIKKIKQKITNL